MGVKFYKYRSILAIYLIKFITKILFVEVPPIFSVTALIAKEGKILFLEYTYMKGLGFPGGVVKSGDDLEEALRREVMEETGLKVVKAKYLESVKSQIFGVATVSAIFKVEADGKIKSSEEGGLKWLDPKEAFGKMAYKDSDITLRNLVGGKY